MRGSSARALAMKRRIPRVATPPTSTSRMSAWGRRRNASTSSGTPLATDRDSHVHHVERRGRAWRSVWLEPRSRRPREERHQLLGHPLLDERLPHVPRGHVDAVGLCVLDQIALDQTARPGTFEGVLAMGASMLTHDAPQVRVGREQRDRLPTRPPCGAKLGHGLPVERDQVVGLPQSPRGLQIECDVRSPRPPGGREARTRRHRRNERTRAQFARARTPRRDRRANRRCSASADRTSPARRRSRAGGVLARPGRLAPSTTRRPGPPAEPPPDLSLGPAPMRIERSWRLIAEAGRLSRHCHSPTRSPGRDPDNRSTPPLPA